MLTPWGDPGRTTKSAGLAPQALRTPRSFAFDSGPYPSILPNPQVNRGTEQGLIFRRFEHRRVLIQAARKVLATEHEARHLSAHDFRHAALTHMAAVGSDLTAIGHVAGHKNATTTALYVQNSEAAARRPVARRAGSLDTNVDTEPDQTGDAVSNPLRAFSRSTLIASLYNHASALAQAGDIEAARVAHEAAGRLLVVPEAANAVVDLNHRRKP